MENTILGILEKLAKDELRYVFRNRWKKRHDDSPISAYVRNSEVRRMRLLVSAIRWLRRTSEIVEEHDRKTA